MQDDLIVRDTRQLQALSNPVRQQMLEHLCREPFTATQLGHLMDMAPARAHYHLKQLVTAGLAELIETRESSGIVEKYYRAVARRFHLTKTVAHDPAGHAAARHSLTVQVRSAVEAFERRVQEEIGPEDGSLPPDVVGGVLDLRLTPARYDRFLARLQALLREFETDSPGPWPGTQVYKILLLAYPDTEAPAQTIPPRPNGTGKPHPERPSP
jgi:DNA-binding transcriptional ArsR family regulator